MNAIEAEQYLEEINKYGSVLGLKSITTLLEEMCIRDRVCYGRIDF